LAESEANWAMFTHWESVARIEQVSSLTSTMLRRFYALDIDDNSRFSRFEQTAKPLDARHVP